MNLDSIYGSNTSYQNNFDSNYFDNDLNYKQTSFGFLEILVSHSLKSLYIKGEDFFILSSDLKEIIWLDQRSVKFFNYQFFSQAIGKTTNFDIDTKAQIHFGLKTGEEFQLDSDFQYHSFTAQKIFLRGGQEAVLLKIINRHSRKNPLDKILSGLQIPGVESAIFSCRDGTLAQTKEFSLFYDDDMQKPEDFFYKTPIISQVIKKNEKQYTATYFSLNEKNQTYLVILDLKNNNLKLYLKSYSKDQFSKESETETKHSGEFIEIGNNLEFLCAPRSKKLNKIINFFLKEETSGEDNPSFPTDNFFSQKNYLHSQRDFLKNIETLPNFLKKAHYSEKNFSDFLKSPLLKIIAEPRNDIFLSLSSTNKIKENLMGEGNTNICFDEEKTKKKIISNFENSPFLGDLSKKDEHFPLDEEKSLPFLGNQGQNNDILSELEDSLAFFDEKEEELLLNQERKGLTILADSFLEEIEKFKIFAKEKGVTFLYKLDDALENYYCDDKIIRDIFSFLLFQSLIHTEQNGKIIIRIENYLDTLVFIRISNQGKAVNIKNLKEAYMSNSLLDQKNPIFSKIQKFVDEYNGSFSVFSRLNEGTTMSVLFPTDSNYENQ